MGDPTPIARSLGSLAAGWGMENPLESARIVASWQEIVGPEIAAKCRPTSLKGGVLKVSTASAAWASEFRYLASAVTARINSHLGSDVVKQIKPWVGPRAKESTNPAASVRGSGPRAVSELPEGTLAEVYRVAGQVGDEALAEALRKALTAAKIRQGAGTEVVQLGSTQSAPPPHSRSKSPPVRHR